MVNFKTRNQKKPMRKRTITNKFQLLYYCGDTDRENKTLTEEIIIDNSMEGATNAEIRKHFRLMLDRFNLTLRPGEYPRYYANVKRERIQLFANGNRNIAFIKL